MHDRRIAALLLGAIVMAITGSARGEVKAVNRPRINTKSDFYIANRAPLAPSPLIKLPIGAIKPRGWLRRQLRLEADGFIGHLGEISRFLKKEGNAWLSPAGEGHSGWEEVPYWLKGYSNTAYVLGDKAMIREAKLWIDAAIASQREDGYFGPRGNLKGRRRGRGKPDLWPNMIMLFILQNWHEHTGDDRVPPLMTKYFRWETTIPDEDFLPPFWQQQRAADNLASVYWLYNRTGDKFLLELGEKIQRNKANWTDGIPNWHNVNMSQAFRGPGIFWQQAKDAKHAHAADRNWREIRAKYGQVPGGMFGGDENCRPGYTGPRQAVETCGMVEMMLSHEMLLLVDGDLTWADRCEDVAFNSLPASTTADFKALRYLTSPNQIRSDAKNKNPGVQNGGPMFLMNPHAHRCCQHNMGHGWPYFAEHLWLATPDGGLAAVMYCASEVTAKVGDGTEVTIAAKTRYPFDETIELAVAAAKNVAFPLYLRVPGWCEAPKLSINGKAVDVKARPRTYLRIERTWADGDRVTLELPAKIALRTWKQNGDCVSVDRGPLTYSLKIGEKTVRRGGTDDWPAWEIHPTTDWNYGLVLAEGDPAGSFDVAPGTWPKDDCPWKFDAAPIALKAQARKIPGWKEDRLGLVGKMRPNPVKTDEPVEAVTLIPMGCARLRISAFPRIAREGEKGHDWPIPEESLHRASHCWGGDTVEALTDGREPKSSNDHSIPRFTWWPRQGSTEWVQLGYKKPRKVSSVAVYWFDDTGRGGCRVPASWRVLWQDGKKWTPVKASGEPGCAKDTFNRVTFEPVTTKALRIEARLQERFSGGILEVRLGGT